MKNPFVIALAAALVTAAAIKAAPAFAEPAGTQPATVVSHVRTADLDLGTSEGRRRLERRLQRAAREACGTPSDADLAAQNNVRECRADAFARGSARIDDHATKTRAAQVIAVSAAR